MNYLIKFDSIANQKFILTFLIVYAHTYAGMHFPSQIDSYNFITVQTMRIAGGAVGTFFAISTILFFRNFTIETFSSKLTSRFKSLVIPYFILSIASFLLNILTLVIKNGSLNGMTLQEAIFSILNGKYDGPIWFLRTLFYFVLISPAIYYLIKAISLRTCIIMFISLMAINAIMQPEYTSLFYWLPIILLFAYIGIKKLTLKVNNIYGYIIMTLLLIMLHFTGWGGENAIPVYIFRMISPIAIILMFNYLTYKPIYIQQYCMFVYLIHGLVLKMPFLSNPYLHFVKTIIIIAISTIIAIIIQRLSPKVYNYISGGR